jgi:hypothetical protein
VSITAKARVEIIRDDEKDVVLLGSLRSAEAAGSYE